ncbi:MAG: tetratricopeptide repeat protein [Candidatus Omnitrophica bacterium]|nr:tetratricopeptide repeat protein [Candidatus Omnitrophota bacterium]
MKNKLFIIVILFAASSLFAADYADVVNKGLFFLKQGMAEEAIKSFESARDAQPSSSIAYYYLGEAYYIIGKRDEALDNYKKAVELEDSNPDYHYALAQLYIATNKTEQAMEELTKTIEIAPSSIKGRQAAKLRDEIRASLGSKEMTEKWARLEEEERKRKEEGKIEEIPPEEGLMPPGFEGMMPGMEGQIAEEEEKIPVEQLIKRVKYGTVTFRQDASAKMLGYDTADLSKVAEDITGLVMNDKDALVRKNMMTALGKTAMPEGVVTLLGIVKDKNERYEMRINALDSISSARTQEVSSVLKTVLDGMVEDRKAAREEAKKNIQEITTKAENLEAQKIKLNMEISEQEQKRFELQSKLDFSGMPMDMLPPGATPPSMPGEPSGLNVQEIKKLREDMRKIDDTLKSKREEMIKAELQLAELLQQKGRYEMLLASHEQRRTDIAMPGSAAEPVRAPEFGGPPGAPPGWGQGPGMEGYPVYEQAVYQETDEDKNEVIFALKLIRAIGEIRDKTGLSAVNKGWEEYGVENERLYYLLTLARLGDFSGIQTLIERLGQDYPQTMQSEEINLRKGIIGIAGEYLIQNPDNRLRELIEFLSEEDVHPEIRGAASSALSIAKIPAK